MPCLDSCVFIDLLRKDRKGFGQAARQLLEALRRLDEPLTTTRLNIAELLVGVHRSRDPAKARRQLEFLLQDTIVLEVDGETAERFAIITAYLQDAGTPIGDMDVLIGAVALTHGQKVVTRNGDHLGLIPGLELVTYVGNQQGDM